MIQRSVLTFVMSLCLVTSAADAIADDVASAEVSYQLFDFYRPMQPIGDDTMRITARNVETEETFAADERTGNLFTLPPGTYEFTGRGQWCYLAPATIEITAGTSSVDLYVGCE